MLLFKKFSTLSSVCLHCVIEHESLISDLNGWTFFDITSFALCCMRRVNVLAQMLILFFFSITVNGEKRISSSLNTYLSTWSTDKMIRQQTGGALVMWPLFFLILATVDLGLLLKTSRFRLYTVGVPGFLPPLQRNHTDQKMSLIACVLALWELCRLMANLKNSGNMWLPKH